MPRLLYASLMRFPNEKAHSLQIAQNCEAFVQAGYEVTLYVPMRFNPPELRAIRDPFAHYGVRPCFRVRRLPVLDIMPWTRGRAQRVAFYLIVASFGLALLLCLLFSRADVYYSRDEWLILLLSLVKPRARLVYEAHLFAQTRQGARAQRWAATRVGHVVAITPRLARDLIEQRGAQPERVLVAHDGYQARRFAALPTRRAARQALGWDETAFVVGFVGRLEMLNMDKGVGRLVEALATLEGVTLALVGGPPEGVQRLAAQWATCGGVSERFLALGQLPPVDIPRFLAACDACAMPHPFTVQFAYYTSPLKLFEYMAAGCAIVASDLPSWADVVQHDQSALLVPPDDSAALRQAVLRLRDDHALRLRLGQAARQQAQAYTWEARAQRIRAFIEGRDCPQAQGSAEAHAGF
ncbi:MAG: glycosyltransferase family 4 protein [Anaerolineae bacterium]|nr:glycosyltransferase family 4 protein [Anaerolineae bacterium]MDW8171844.1 glycosyltransferase family 4 protein [Anaerolineae bacterium]